MKRTCIAILLLLLSGNSLAETPQPLCVASTLAMPESWRPTGKVQESLSDAPPSDAPWSEREAEDAKRAIRMGLQEMIDLFARRPEAVHNIG